ncbi:hypothetical protein FPZ54_13790 [Sphingomonas suaedae]|uniref:Pyridine nucleotide-disulfide oxidoreductase n=1 Tax=Sphingomonas suaedae TaxID=2599297 RepID=A0A518RHN0_9SPHN|nr:hypothetical protein [Sphingomonas suaedae]QDX26968.1 hypothetical protein FPZ54_13790 [Sphingomonas suaedae]
MADKRLILLGAGHAHLLLTERLETLREAGIDPVLIAPRWFDYSGLATGVLSGALPSDANRIDVASLARRRGLAFVEGMATAIDRTDRVVTLASGSRHRFDLLSLNIGSVVGAAVTGGDVCPVKPLSGLTALRARIESGREFPRVLIVGAGPSGIEVAAALLGLAERIGAVPRVTLVARSADDMRAWQTLLVRLSRRGLRLHCLGTALPGHDVMIAATGLRAPTLIDAAKLATHAGRGAAVAATLQSTIDPAIFAAGDCADFQPRAIQRQGVFGVRQAPVLIDNLAAVAVGLPLRPFRPQRRWLAIMDLGDGTGYATWGPLAWQGRAMLRLKRHLDRSFVRRFQ